MKGIGVLLEADRLAISKAPDVHELRAHRLSRCLVGAQVSTDGDDRVTRIKNFVNRNREPVLLAYAAGEHAI